MEAHVERIHQQYGAEEQAKLRVRITVPGSRKGFHNLSAGERKEEFEVEATDWKAAYKFPATRTSRRSRLWPSSSSAKEIPN